MVSLTHHVEIWSVEAGQLDKKIVINFLFLLVGGFGSFLYFHAEFEARKSCLGTQAWA